MTVGQLLFDVELWLRRYAIAETIGRPELKVLFFEVFQEVYNLAIAMNPEVFVKSQAFNAQTIALPADFYALSNILVTSANCTSGGVRVVDRERWNSMQSNRRLKGTEADPLGRLDATIIHLSNSRQGIMYYYRNYNETHLSSEATELATILPVPYHKLISLKMQEKVRLRQRQIPDAAVGNQAQVRRLAKSAYTKLAKSLKHIQTVDDQTILPLTLVA